MIICFCETIDYKVVWHEWISTVFDVSDFVIGPDQSSLVNVYDVVDILKLCLCHFSHMYWTLSVKL